MIQANPFMFYWSVLVCTCWMGQYWTALISIGSLDTAGIRKVCIQYWLFVFNINQYVHDLFVLIGTDLYRFVLIGLYWIELISIGSFSAESLLTEYEVYVFNTYHLYSIQTNMLMICIGQYGVHIVLGIHMYRSLNTNWGIVNTSMGLSMSTSIQTQY